MPCVLWTHLHLVILTYLPGSVVNDRAWWHRHKKKRSILSALEPQMMICSPCVSHGLCLCLQRWRTTSLRTAPKCESTPVWRAWRTTCWETEEDRRSPTPGSGIRSDIRCAAVLTGCLHTLQCTDLHCYWSLCRNSLFYLFLHGQSRINRHYKCASFPNG